MLYIVPTSVGKGRPTYLARGCVHSDTQAQTDTDLKAVVFAQRQTGTEADYQEGCCVCSEREAGKKAEKKTESCSNIRIVNKRKLWKEEANREGHHPL